MAERQALDDLLAAINGNPSNEQNPVFPSVSPVPSVPLSQLSDQVTDPAATNPLIAGARQIAGGRQASGQLSAAAHVAPGQQVPRFNPGRPALSPTTSKENNLIELENLLGNRSSSSSASRQTRANTQTMFAQQPVSGAAPSRHQIQLRGAYGTGGVNPSITASLTRQQLANAKAIPNQRAMNAANAARQNALMQANAGAQRKSGGIPSELAAGMTRNAGTSNVARSQAHRVPSGSSAAAQRPGGHRNPQAGQSRGFQGREITQEQIIVGHFCRHAIKTLARVMQNNPRAKEAEALLKDHIKTVWAKWVRLLITRPQLLESVANCVRSSCEAAAGIDVIREFKAWYEREYEKQKERTGVDPTEQARRQAQHAQRRNPAQNSMSAMRAQGAAMPTNGGTRGPAAIRTPSGNKAMLAARQKAEAQLAHQKAEARLAHQKAEAQLAQHKGEVQLVSTTGGKRLANKTIPAKQTGTGRAVAGKTLAGRGAGRGIAGKSLGGKGISRPPNSAKVANMGVGRGQTIMRTPVVGRGTPIGKVPMVGRGAGIGKSPSLGRGSPLGPGAALVNEGVGSDGMVGGKGLLSNKSPAASKPKAPRKAVPKGPTRPVGKVSPKNMGTKQKPPPANPAAFVAAHGVPGVIGTAVAKRPLDQSGTSPQGPLPKKAKPQPKVNKGPTVRKKPPGLPVSGSPAVQKGTKPPPARPEMFKGRPLKRPGQPSPLGTSTIAMGKGLLPGQGNASQPPLKKPRRADDGMDELSVVNNIVDIEDEEDKLGIDAGGDAPEVQEVFDYGADMLLAGPQLRHKMQTITKRLGVDGNVGKDIMEMVSLAVRERLSEIFESLREIASIRTDEDKMFWKTSPAGLNVHDRLMRMRQDEERSLKASADRRVKRRKEQMEQEAKKHAGENASNDKKTKDSSAAAEAERKEKLALEKKRKEHSSQRDALSALVRNTDARRKKPSTSKGLVPLESLGKKVLPPIPKIVGAGGVISAGSSSKDGMIKDPLEKLRAIGPLVPLGRANDPRNNEPQAVTKTEVKRRLTLRDCLYLMEKERNTRKSSLLYKWYARLGTHDYK